MNMQVETYEIEESERDASEVDAEAVALIRKLGLKGQQALVVKSEADGADRRVPYAEMTRQEHAVYEALFPQVTAVDEYAAGIIPIRVLHVIAHARELFDRLEVWHKKMRDPDPILVGHFGKPYTSAHKLFVLARWGDALKPFAALVEEARGELVRKYTVELKERIAAAKENLDKVDLLVEKRLAGETVYL